MVARSIESLSGTIVEWSEAGFRFGASLTLPQVQAVLRMDEVVFVDEAGTPGEDMDTIREIVGANYLESFPSPSPRFTGRGVRGEVMDSWINPNHVAFRNVIRHDPGDVPAFDDQSHGSACYGICFGTGMSAITHSGKGLLPDAGIPTQPGIPGDSEGAGIFATYYRLTCRGGTIDRYRHTAELVGYPDFQLDPENPVNLRAVFQSNSWGCASSTKYDTWSAEVDDITFLMDILFCQSQGNNGIMYDPSCTNAINSRSDAWAKNVVSVGAVRHSLGSGAMEYGDANDLNDRWWNGQFLGSRRWSGSGDPCLIETRNYCAASAGPAVDDTKRIKPDLCGFYDYVGTTTSLNNMTSPPNDLYTCLFNGTSSATPIVAGCFGLFFQMWHQQQFNTGGGAATVFSSRPHLSTAKAMMINTAFRYDWNATMPTYPNPDITRMRQGWGRPDLKRLYDLRQRMFIVNETSVLTFGDTATYNVQVDGAAFEPGRPLRVTLVWTDPAANPAVVPDQVNELDLRVVSPSNVVYRGNVRLMEGNWSTPVTPSDTVDKSNTTENVFIQNPEVGTWHIYVTAVDIPIDGHLETPTIKDVDFGLVVSGITPIALHAPPDWNGDGKIDSRDLVDYLDAYLRGDGDYDKDGKTTSADMFMFVDAFLN